MIQNFTALLQEPRKVAVLVLLLSLFLTGSMLLSTNLLTPSNPEFDQPWDHHKYIYMAEQDPLDFHIAPFCWRILNPLLAKWLPFDLQSNFLLITFTGIWITGVAVFFLANRFTNSVAFGFVGMLIYFSLGWAVKYGLYNFWLPDSFSMMLMIVAIYGILTKNDYLFMFFSLIGVGFKEGVIFVTPLYYTLNTDRFYNWRLIRKNVFLALPVVVFLIIIRILIPPLNDDLKYLSTLPDTLKIVQEGVSTYNYGALVKMIGLQRLNTLTIKSVYDYSIGTFGVWLVFLPLVCIRKNSQLFVRLLPFLLLVYAQPLFAINTRRLLIIGFPALLLLALNGAKTVSERLQINPLFFAFFSFLYVILNLISPDFMPPIFLQLSVLGSFLLLIFTWWRIDIHRFK